MRVLSSVVAEHPSWSVTIAAAQLPKRCAVRGQFVRRECLRMDALVLEQFAQQSQSGLGIAAFLDENVQNLAFIIDGPP